MDCDPIDFISMLMGKCLVGSGNHAIRFLRVIEYAKAVKGSTKTPNAENLTNTLGSAISPIVGKIEVGLRHFDGQWMTLKAKYEIYNDTAPGILLTIKNAPASYAKLTSNDSITLQEPRRHPLNQTSNPVILYFSIKLEEAHPNSALSASSRDDAPYARMTMKWRVDFAAGSLHRTKRPLFSIHPTDHPVWTLENSPDKVCSGEVVAVPLAGPDAGQEVSMTRANTATPPLNLAQVPRSLSDLFSPTASPPQNPSAFPVSPNRNAASPLLNAHNMLHSEHNLSPDIRLDNSSELPCSSYSFISLSQAIELEGALAQMGTSE